ncbi:uncharacterized protein isoform X1 [Leptinotarsa decemlineata]|uniref:uncharacterized protein isoform X1 n=1 Tax=Leptinotarsa decemlineata TaxID=7539 RepID=UPI003D307858
MTVYRIEPFEKCHREMFGDLVLTCQTPIQGELPRRLVLPVTYSVEVRRASADSATNTRILESEKRRASALVDELLMDIYYSVHNSTDYNSTSGKSHRSSWVEVVNLEEKEVAELSYIMTCLTNYTERMGSVLVRQLKRRDALRRQQEAYCDVITRKLQERLPQSAAPEDMRFMIQPLPGDTGFSQWCAAMKMVAQLPGGIPPEFRSRLWLTLAERHLAAKGVNWPEVERTCFSEWSHPADAELGVQIVKDLHRTGCSLFCGENGQENQALLKRVLLAYARWNKAVGYCQGFNMLAALILQVTERCETDALKLMIYLVEGVLPDSYFADSLRGLSVDMAVFRELLRSRLPRLSKHLDTLQNAAKDGSRSYEPPLTNVFTMQWFLTLFCNCLPQPTVLRVWDLILLEGNEILLRTALAIWQVLAERILSARSADEFYCIMGVLMRELLEFGLIDGNSLIKAVVAIGPLTELKTLREHYLYNINPWGAASLPQTVEKQLKLYPRHALALDISSLKKQYAKLKQRQRQAHIIFSAAISRQPPPTPPVTMNHLLIGKSALVPAKRLGPPKGSIPPARQVPSTLHWKDAPKQTSSSSSSDTELCDEESVESSDEDVVDNLPQDSGTDLMKIDNSASIEDTVSQTLETELADCKESDEDNLDFEQFLADRVKCLKVEDPEERINCARRNSERALQIIQENSLILHRILQCQSRLSPSPPLKVDEAGTAPPSHSYDAPLPKEIDKEDITSSRDLNPPEYGSRYTSILEKSKSLDEKYNALILNKPMSKTAEELNRNVEDTSDVLSNSPREKSQHFFNDYRIGQEPKSMTKSYENLPVVHEETVDNTNTDKTTTSDLDFIRYDKDQESIQSDPYFPRKFNFNDGYSFGQDESNMTDKSSEYVSEYLSKINQTVLESRESPSQFCGYDESFSKNTPYIFPFVNSPNVTKISREISDINSPNSVTDENIKETADSAVSLIDSDFKNYLFLSNEEIAKSPDSPRHQQKEITPLRERVYTTFDQLLNPEAEDKDSGVYSTTDFIRSMNDSRTTTEYFVSQTPIIVSEDHNKIAMDSGSFPNECTVKSVFPLQISTNGEDNSSNGSIKSPTVSKSFSSETKHGLKAVVTLDATEHAKPSVKHGEIPTFKSPKRSPLRSPLKSPLRSPSNCFNPFPVPLSSRQSKEVPLKLGLYKK